MYDFNEGLPLGGLLEQLSCAAIAAENGLVREFNTAAYNIIPTIREGDKLRETDDGRVEICGASFEATRYTVGEFVVYTFTVPRADIENAWPLIENTSLAMLEALNSAFAASELIDGSVEKQNIENIKRYNAILSHSHYKLRHIAENLRELGELSMSPKALSPKLFDLNTLCRDIVETVYTLIKRMGVSMEYSCDGDDFIVFADRERVERMILDVFANSVGSFKDGGSISVLLRKLKNYLQITIKDNGKGMEPEVLSHVFDSYNIPAEPVSEPRGLGLSLAVARNIALRHGGSLVVESEPGKGTSVIISLPEAPRGNNIELRTSSVKYGGNNMNGVLTALSGVLGYEFYMESYR